MKFHLEQWTGKEWIRISGPFGYDRLEQAELQKASRARSTRTDIDNFSIVCYADENTLFEEAA
jgi:hypothetical protein